MNQREAFEAAIRDNPYDEVTRKVFADWLDEHDEPELADFQRSWTAAKYDAAKAWLAEFAAEFGAYSDIEEMVREGVGDHIVMHGNNGDDAAQFLRRDSDLRQKFWDSYQMVAGAPVPEGVRQRTSFSCSC